jgi:CPA2 family monovalent cation:H+ antiporter-2
MAIALPDPMSTRLSLKRALELAPDLDVVVRAEQEKDINLLYQLGAKEVVQPELEASLELSAHLLTSIGIPLPIIQREVQQIRSSHYENLISEREPQQGSPLAGMTLEETDLRRLTGVSLMAIRRDEGEEIDYPDPQTPLQAGDRLLIVGDADEMAAFGELAKGETVVPEQASCQWLLVPDDSHVIGKTLAELHIRQQFGILIQAIRRESKYIRFPNGASDLQAGDRLLLCGNFHSLTQASSWIAPESSKVVQFPLAPAVMPDLVPFEDRLPIDRLPIDQQRIN